LQFYSDATDVYYWELNSEKVCGKVSKKSKLFSCKNFYLEAKAINTMPGIGND